MKKLLCLVLIASFILSLAGCAASSPNDNYPSNNNGGLQIDGITSDDGGSWWNDLFGGTGGGKNESAPADPSIGMSPEEPDVDVEEPSDNTYFENPFVNTKDEPVSTFSADVDTASYTYFRKLVQSGYNLSELIATAGKSIRTEEMINYFNYNYDAPVEGELFSKTVAMTKSPWNHNSYLLMVGIQAAEIQEESKNNLVFLIDVSGSMGSSDKLPLLQRSFAHLVDNLDADDTVSIVTYSGVESVVLEGCAARRT